MNIISTNNVYTFIFTLGATIIVTGYLFTGGQFVKQREKRQNIELKLIQLESDSTMHLLEMEKSIVLSAQLLKLSDEQLKVRWSEANILFLIDSIKGYELEAYYDFQKLRAQQKAIEKSINVQRIIIKDSKDYIRWVFSLPFLYISLGWMLAFIGGGLWYYKKQVYEDYNLVCEFKKLKKKNIKKQIKLKQEINIYLWSIIGLLLGILINMSIVFVSIWAME